MNSELEIISEGLQENHTILGLHMVGNERNINAMGFLIESETDPSASHVLTRL